MMNPQGIAPFLKTALALLTADVFFHPVWLHFCVMNPAAAASLAGELKREARRLAAERNWLDACRVSLICASLHTLRGSASAALESLQQTYQMASRHDLVKAAIWAAWGASAVCVQMGEYEQSAGYLLRLQQELYRNNEWVLANLIELVRQSLMERGEDGMGAGVRSSHPPQDLTGQLIERMLGWGKSPPETALDPGEASYLWVTMTSQPETGYAFRARGWRYFWQNLLRFLRGELRLQFIAVKKPAVFRLAQRPLLLEPADIKAPETIPFSKPVTANTSGEQLAALPDLPIPISGGIKEQSRAPGESFFAPVEAASSGVETQKQASPAETWLSASPAPPEATTFPVLNAYLLGSFRVALGGIVIDDWPSGRSRAVFAYLLAHHAHPVSREVLMETFWPENSLDSARNSLNVAVYTLRHTLKELTDSPVILSHESAYQINPDLRLWVDMEEFEKRVHGGLQQERAGTVDQAVLEYRMAVDLYQGDFLADTPYEDWTTQERERLRVLHLETLDHLSIIYLNQGLYSASVRLCQLILSYDACREDAHCRLMRCYVRQGQAHLALRQYQTCVEALREELDVMPSPTTVQLCEQIKRQEMV